MSFDWIVPGAVAAMARPWPEDLPWLREVGVRAVLSLSERVPEGFPSQGLAHLHLPVRDFAPPTQEQLARAVEFIREALDSAKPCAVHCGAGRGRTGTVVAAWLVSRGLTASEAIAEVRRRRPGSVETEEHEESVALFARALGRAGDA